MNRGAAMFWRLAILLALAGQAFAHPMGNFSVNQESKIRLRPGSVELRYFVDMAEIPTYEQFQEAGIHADPADARTSAYLARAAKLFLNGINLTVDGVRLPLAVKSSQVIFPAGAGGLPTMKIAVVYTGAWSASTASRHELRFADKNFPWRTGWKEVVIESVGVSLLNSTAPDRDRSHELSDYPTDLLNSPPQQLEAAAGFTAPLTVLRTAPRRTTATTPVTAESAASPSSAPASITPAPASVGVIAEHPLTANQQGTPRNRFTELLAGRQFSLGFLLAAIFISMGLGALHALEPGHGKTIVAAYLVGSRGTARDAIVLGTVVTATHTAGVYLLGFITLYASRYIVPERLYPWMGMLSGLMIAMLAVAMFLQSRTGAAIAHPHLEGQAHSHSHWNLFARTPAVLSVSGDTQAPVPLRRLLALGVTGGMIPCPAALVVLLSAVALHRIAEGLLLIVAFSAGLAAVLIAIGLVMVHAGRIVSKWTPSSAILSWLPACSSTLIFLLGCGLVLQAAGALGFTMHWPEEMKAPALLYAVGLGLVLGMRHSTDADHVVAVTTIVSRQRSIGSAAAIGALWGVGHTFTIFLVGSAIILFNVVIPARVGLAMEFAVALMLVLLGVLNLSGVISRLSRRFSAVRVSAQASPAGEDGEFSRVPWLRGLGRYQLLRPLVIGTVHGLAGSAAVALLVLTTIRTPAWAVAYLCVFGFGTVLGMMFMTAAMALPFAFAKNGFARMNSYVGVTSGVVSFAFGLFLVYQIGFVDGLFTSAPRWSPH